MGFWGYGGGYPWLGGSAYGSPWMGGAGYPGYMPGMPMAGPSASHGETAGETAEPPHKRGGITGFFQGIAQGAVNTLKGIVSPGGLLMVGGTAALTWMTAGAILPVLGVLGLGVGTYQLCKGIASGDSEKMGEGIFSFGLSALGFLGPKTVPLDKAKYALAHPDDGIGAKLLQWLKAPFGFSNYQRISRRGNLQPSDSKNLYELSWEKIRQKYATMQTTISNHAGGSGHPASGSGAAPASSSSGSRLNLLSSRMGWGTQRLKLQPEDKEFLGRYLKKPARISNEDNGTVQKIQDLLQQRKAYINAKMRWPTYYFKQKWWNWKYSRELSKLKQLHAEIQKLHSANPLL